MTGEEARAALAQNIRNHAKKRRISLREVARRAGVSYSTLFNIVWGQHSAGLDRIARIAEVFGLDPWQILKPSKEFLAKRANSADPGPP